MTNTTIKWIIERPEELALKELVTNYLCRLEGEAPRKKGIIGDILRKKELVWDTNNRTYSYQELLAIYANSQRCFEYMILNRSFLEQIVVNKGYGVLSLPRIKPLFEFLITADFIFFLFENFPECINEYKDYSVQLSESETDKLLNILIEHKELMEQTVIETDSKVRLINTEFIKKKFYGEMSKQQKNIFSRQLRAKCKE